MNAKSFSEGFVLYTVTHELPANLSFNNWDDGYAAFSNCEKRLRDIQGRNFLELVKDRVTNIAGVEGYLMELDLWRHKDGIYEEISIEREDRGFLFQQWKLKEGKVSPPLTGGDEGEGVLCLCYWRFADTQPRANSIFKGEALNSIEVIVPEHRLHFFLTVGGGNDGKRQG